MPRDITKRALIVGSLIIFIYIGVAIIVTWPLVANLSSQLPSGSRDTLVHYWNGWWVRHALTSGQNPFYTPLLFYPKGISLVTHNIAWFNVATWFIFEPLLGGITAYNFAILLSIILCGLAVFWLSYRLTDHLGAAFLAGLIYLAWPFRINQLDHPNLIATQWIPVFFLFLIYTIQRGRWRDALLAGLFFALIGYTRWQLLIAASTMALIYFLIARREWFPENRRHILWRLLFAGAVASLLLLPPFLMLLRETLADQEADFLLREGDEVVMQTDLLSYLAPSEASTLFGDETQPFFERIYHDRSEARRETSYIGIVTLVLAILGIKYSGRKSLPWLVMAIVLILLALGPFLRLNGKFYERVPTLYGLLSPIGIYRLMRVPHRYNMFLALPVSILAAYGLAAALPRLRDFRRWLPTVTVVILAFMILLDYLMVPVPLIDPKTFESSFFTEMAEEPGTHAVVNIPFSVLRSKIFMYQQTLHQQPIVQGKIARIPADQYTFIDNHPLLSLLSERSDLPPAATDVGRMLASLSEDDIGYLLIDKQQLLIDRLNHWQRYLFYEPRFDDAAIAAYTTAPIAGQDFEILDEPVPGLGPVVIYPSTNCLTPGSIVEIDVGWGSTISLDHDYDVSLSLNQLITAEGQDIGRFPLSEGWPTSQWPENALAWGYYRPTIPASITPGEYAISLSLIDAATGQFQGGPLPISSLAVQDKPCNLAILPEANDANASYGGAIRLVEYQVIQQPGQVGFIFTWRAEQRMNVDYKYFVHIFDQETYVPVAQYDGMPNDWTHPTSIMWPGEVLTDPVQIPLVGVPAGTYGIAVGVYDPATGERLQLIDGTGQEIPDGRLVLEEVVVIPGSGG